MNCTDSLSPRPPPYFFYYFFFFFSLCVFFNTSLSVAGNPGRLTWVKDSKPYSFLSVCAVFLCVSPNTDMTIFGCQCSGCLTCAQMLMHAIATGGCTESALKVDSGTEKNPLPYRGLEPASVLRLASQSNALPTELSPPLESKHEVKMCLSRQLDTFYLLSITG